MPTIPTPVITPVANLPWSSTADTVALSGSGSLASTGNTITGYQWTIFEQPEGVTGTWPTDPNAAYLTNATTATPTLNNVVLPGSYGIILVVSDDNPDPDLDSSYTSHVPTQLTSAQDGLYGLDAGQFAGPIPSQIVWVRKEEQYSGLVKPGRGDRGWFSFAGGHWDLIDKVEEFAQYVSEEETGIRHYDEIHELTPDHGVVIEGALLKDGNIKTETSSNSVWTNYITAGSASGGPSTISVSATQISTGGDFYCGGAVYVDAINEYAPTQGVTIDGVLIKDGDVKVATSTDKIYTNEIQADSLAGGSTTLLINSTSATFSGEVHVPDELFADLISAESNNSSVTIRGTGTHNSDITTDVIAADSNDSGVTILGKGTHAYDLQADVINANTVIGATTLDLTAPAGDLTLLMDDNGSVLSLQAPDGSVVAYGKDMWLTSDTTDLLLVANTTNVVARGGPGMADLRTDVIEPDTDDSGVTINGRGTHTYDLVTAVINADSVIGSTTISVIGTTGTNVVSSNNDVYIEGNDEIVMDARGAAGSGLGVITAIGKLKAQGGTSSSRYRVPVCLDSAVPLVASNGTSNQVVYTFTLPANSMIVAGDSVKGKVTVACLTNKNNVVRVKFNGNTIVQRTAPSGTTNMMVDFSVIARSSSTQTATAHYMESNSGGVYAHTSLSVNCTNSTTITVEFDTSAASDATLETVSLELWCV